ncbi:golgin subfamily A member 1 isoform X2 [Hyalella azteca]|uniref:Golgin subfamily A member 1 isoform X2 n=1 Tax=Hyalella azteca TaxID=294128 RepID=A0A979FI18_HYAAZ|nr:golgin subfamily A member 1 isoform X2 [Hyalella azteca]
MFGNLKSKLEGVADLKKYAAPQNLANSVIGSRQRSGSHTPSIPASPAVPVNPGTLVTNVLSSQIQANGSRKGPPSSLPSISHSPLSNSSSRSHSREASLTSLPLSPGFSPIPSLDGKDSTPRSDSPMSPTPPTPTKQQDTLAREVVKLRAALEQQQDAHLARLSAKETEWRGKCSHLTDKVSEIQEALQKKDITISSLQKELDASKELTKRLQDVQEDCDELEGLSVQEAAKIKHMLLNTSTELESARCQLRERAVTQAALEADLQTAQHKSRQQITQLQHKVEQLQQEVRHLEQCRQQQLRTSSDDCGLKELQEQHADREKSLLDKVEEWRSKCSSLEAELSAEQAARQEELMQHQQHQQQCGPQLEAERTKHAAAISTLQAEHRSEVDRLQERLIKEKEKTCQRVTEERERAKKEALLEVEKCKEEVRKVQEECRLKEISFEEELVRQKKALEEEKRCVIEERDKEKVAAKQMQQQLAAALAARDAACQDAEAARGAARTAEQRYQQLQNLLEEVQQQKQTQVAAEKAKSERLQSALSAERAEKQSLETAKLELENKQQVLLSEKTKLSEHLDEFAARVTTLQGERDEQLLHTAHLRESLEQLQQQLRQSQQKAGEWESDALTSLQEEHATREQELQATVQQLQQELQEKQQTFKLQQQRIADMKKTMQRELRISPEQQTEQTTNAASPQPSRHTTSDMPRSHSAAVLPSSSYVTRSSAEVPAFTKDGLVDPINLEYLKHVVLKFITSREYEAVHLTKAVATLLHLTPTEQQLLQDTLNWRMSWFGPKPQLGKGQQAYCIPPSH